MRNETHGENGIVFKGIISEAFQSMKRASDISPFPLVSLWDAYVPILLREVEQDQRPSRNGDREAIVVGVGLCDGEGERAYTGYAPTLEGKSTENFVETFTKGIFFLNKMI